MPPAGRNQSWKLSLHVFEPSARLPSMGAHVLMSLMSLVRGEAGGVARGCRLEGDPPPRGHASVGCCSVAHSCPP